MFYRETVLVICKFRNERGNTRLNNTYWRNQKLDYLDQVIMEIDSDNDLKHVTEQMSSEQIVNTFRELEDPYSLFNQGREYNSYYWSRFKAAAW